MRCELPSVLRFSEEHNCAKIFVSEICDDMLLYNWESKALEKANEFLLAMLNEVEKVVGSQMCELIGLNRLRVCWIQYVPREMDWEGVRKEEICPIEICSGQAYIKSNPALYIWNTGWGTKSEGYKIPTELPTISQM